MSLQIVILNEFPLQDDLVDYVVTESFLMTLWTTQAGDTQVLTSPRSSGHTEEPASDWQSVPLAPTQDSLALPPGRDAREVYVDTIFSPLMFCPQVCLLIIIQLL